MILFLRTDKPESELYIHDAAGKQIYSHTWEAHRQLAETLHHKIRSAFSEVNKDLKDTTGIVVFEGPGSFTGLRIGMSVANALAYSLTIPVVGAAGNSWKTGGLEALKTAALNTYPAPNYATPAHTTTPKK